MKSTNYKEPANQVHADNKSMEEKEQLQNANGRVPMMSRWKSEWQNNRDGILKTAAVVTVAAVAVGLTVYLMRKKNMMSAIRNSGLVTGGLALSQKLMDTAEAVTHKVADTASAVRHNLMDSADIVSHQVADTACSVTGKVKEAVV